MIGVGNSQLARFHFSLKRICFYEVPGCFGVGCLNFRNSGWTRAIPVLGLWVVSYFVGVIISSLFVPIRVWVE